MTSLALDTSYISIVCLLCSAGKYCTYSKRPFLSSVTLLAIVGAVQALPLQEEERLFSVRRKCYESNFHRQDACLMLAVTPGCVIMLG